MNKPILPVVVLAVSMLAAGCNESGHTAKTTPQNPVKFDFAYDKREVYLADAIADLAVLDQSITELTGQAAMAGETVKADAQPKIQELLRQRAGVSQKLEVLKKADEANWNDAKRNYLNAYNEAMASCQQAREWLAAELKTGSPTTESPP